LALFSYSHFSYIIHYQHFKSKNTVTPISFDFPSFPCGNQANGIPLQQVRVLSYSDFDSTGSTRRDGGCCLQREITKKEIWVIEKDCFQSVYCFQ
jgi:hypothetical protein